MYNFVVFSLSRWNIEYGCNIKDMSIELSKHHRVLYIDVPLKRKERWLKKSDPAVVEVEERIARGAYLHKVANNLWHYIDNEILESVNSFSNNFLFDVVNRINNKRFAKSIRKAISEVGFKEYILLNDNDIYNGFYLQKMLRPSLYVYYLRDRLPAMEYWKKQTTRLEPQLIREVNLIVANSQYLSDYAKAFNTNSFYVGQGCDINYFLEQPDSLITGTVLDEIAKPIVGYMGALNSERLDIGLLTELASRLKDFNFVLVGQEDTSFKESRLHQMNNVYFLGRKNFSELPKILYRFDIAINPQVINEITIGNYPRKVDEYLAAGKPVVATETVAMKPFEEYTYLGKNADDYEKLIKRAILEDTAEKQNARRKFASTHTWENNIDEVIKSIDSTVHGKRG